jgi:branched-chain amino acid transport system permease protein
MGAYTVALVQNKLSDSGTPGSWILAVSLVLIHRDCGARRTAAARLRGPYLVGVTPPSRRCRPATTLDETNGTRASPSGADPPPSGRPCLPERAAAGLAALGAALLVMLLLANLVHSRFGRSFRAIRDDEVAPVAGRPRAHPGARVRGRAGRAGLSGGLFAILNSVSPGAFAPTLSLSCQYRGRRPVAWPGRYGGRAAGRPAQPD